MKNPQRIVITGASSGLGYALATSFAAKGSAIAMLARGQAALDKACNDVERLGGRGIPIAVDISHPDMLRSAGRIAVENLGGAPDLVIHNAAYGPLGSMGRHDSTFDDDPILKPLLDVSVADFEKAWKTNCLAPLVLSQVLIPSMIKLGSGTIIFIGATASSRAKANYGTFAMSKFALKAVAECLSNELKEHGLHIAHLVLDGVVDIPRMESLTQHLAREQKIDPADVAKLIAVLHGQSPQAWRSEHLLRPAVDSPSSY
jgi:NAD(P)-dependent dehydrogenase (short-subunit alcohol dehydrogenase family)